MTVHLTAGAATGIGSLPHVDPYAAAAFVLERLPDLPAIPSLPQRSPAESMLAQAAAGIPGVDVDAQGGLVVDRATVDPWVPIETDLDGDAFGGLRGFLDVAQGWRGPVKWQFTGPITFGLALLRPASPGRPPSSWRDEPCASTWSPSPSPWRRRCPAAPRSSCSTSRP